MKSSHFHGRNSSGVRCVCIAYKWKRRPRLACCLPAVYAFVLSHCTCKQRIEKPRVPALLLQKTPRPVEDETAVTSQEPASASDSADLISVRWLPSLIMQPGGLVLLALLMKQEARGVPQSKCKGLSSNLAKKCQDCTHVFPSWALCADTLQTLVLVSPFLVLTSSFHFPFQDLFGSTPGAVFTSVKQSCMGNSFKEQLLSSAKAARSVAGVQVGGACSDNAVQAEDVKVRPSNGYSLHCHPLHQTLPAAS